MLGCDFEQGGAVGLRVVGTVKVLKPFCSLGVACMCVTTTSKLYRMHKPKKNKQPNMFIQQDKISTWLHIWYLKMDSAGGVGVVKWTFFKKQACSWQKEDCNNL